MMSTTESSTNPADLEQQANATREEVDRTLEAIENRFSVRRKIDAASAAIGAAANRASKWASPEITTMIRLDHTHVLAAFRRYRSYLSGARKRALVANACLGLELHAQLEEEIFYPAARSVLNASASDLLDAAEVEHGSIKSLIAGIQEALDDDGADEKTDAKVMVLREYVSHHVKEEESKLFPKLKKSDLDLDEIGSSLRTRKEELLGELA